MVTNSIPAPLEVPKQLPLDAKRYFASELELADLGTGNNKAFTYYKNMIAEVANGVDYVWREVEVGEENTGMVTTDFTYPANVISNSIDYSNKTYNFFLKTTVTQEFSVENLGEGAGVYKETEILPSEKKFKLKSLKASNVGDGIGVFNDIKTSDENVLEFRYKSLKTNTLDITEADGVISINTPPVFSGKDYYVNPAYSGTELGTPSKPFITLDACIAKILDTGGENYAKWEDRGGETIRVIIQGATTATQNLAINRVTYILDGFEKGASITTTNLDYILDMTVLPIQATAGSGPLPYQIDCAIIGKGYLINNTPTRKGYIKVGGYNDPGTSVDQPDCIFKLGDTSSSIVCLMEPRTDLTYVELTDSLSATILRDGEPMKGYQSLSDPNYGAIEVVGKNKIFAQSLFITGTIEVECYEQHLLYVNNGSVYGDSGQLYLKRNYRYINYSSSALLAKNTGGGDIQKYYQPATNIYDIYVKNGGDISYSGEIYTQENTSSQQGGQEAFVCVESINSNDTSAVSFNGGGTVANLFYNHIFKVINQSGFANYITGQINAKNLRISSTAFISIYNVVNESGITYNTVVQPSNIFINIALKNTFHDGTKVIPFSEMVVKDKLFISTTSTILGNTIFSPSMPSYASNALALVDLPIGTQYLDSGDFSIKITH